jgi:hypothetical protein
MSNDLTEALTAAGVSALVQKQIDPMLLEYQRRYSPLTRSLPSVKWGSTVYNFNQRNSRVPGGFVADGGARPVGTSSYTQSQFTIRNLQAVGSVTGYAQEVTRDLIGDLRAREIEGAVQSLLWDIETGICWGNSGSTAAGPYPQFDGLDSQISAFTGSTQNSFDEAGAALALRHLDILIDSVEQNASQPVQDASWMFVMSTTANSKIAQLLTNQQRFNDTVEVAAGLVVPTYRNVPLIKSSFLGARNMTMGAVTSATSGTGGSLAAGTFYYKVAAVIARVGEIVASAEVSQVIASGTTNTVTLSFTPPTGYENGTAISYKVYRSTTTGTETLLGYVDATVGLAGDGVTPIVANQIVDTGAALVPQQSVGSVVPSVTPSAYVGTNAGMLPRSSGGEDVFLLSRNRDNVVRPYVRDVTPLDVYPTTSAPDTLPFAIVSDTCLAVRAPKYGGRLRNVVSSL